MRLLDKDLLSLVVHIKSTVLEMIEFLQEMTVFLYTFENTLKT